MMQLNAGQPPRPNLKPGSSLFLSASHRSTHFDIFPRELSLPTFTVAIMRTQSSDSAKHVSSKNELCSEYGTPYRSSDAVEFFIGLRFAWVKVRLCAREMTEEMEGRVSVPTGAVNVQPVGRKPTTLSNLPV